MTLACRFCGDERWARQNAGDAIQVALSWRRNRQHPEEGGIAGNFSTQL
jgi:hypothetical protein